MSGTIEFIDKYISKCEDCSDEKAECLIQEIVSTFSADIPNILSDLYYYLMPPTIDYAHDLKVLMGKLKRYKAKIEDEKEVNTSNPPIISISQNQTNIQSIRISLEQTVNAIEAISEDKLSQDEKNELLKELTKLESEKDKSKIWEGAQSVLKWIADKSVDVAIAALPYIVEVLKNNL